MAGVSFLILHVHTDAQTHTNKHIHEIVEEGLA